MFYQTDCLIPVLHSSLLPFSPWTLFSDGFESPCLSLLTPFPSPLVAAAFHGAVSCRRWPPPPGTRSPRDCGLMGPTRSLGLSLAALYHGPLQSPHFPDPFPRRVKWVTHPHLCIFKQGNLGQDIEVSLLHLKNRDLASKPERFFLSVYVSDDEGCICVCCPRRHPQLYGPHRDACSGLWIPPPPAPASSSAHPSCPTRGGWRTVFCTRRRFMY